MTNTYADKTLTESMLANEYSDNGVVFPTNEEAKAFLTRKGFALQGSFYKGKYAKTARIYKLRDAVLSNVWPHKPVRFTPKGFLVSFGGEPRSCYDLKFTKIIKPKF